MIRRQARLRREYIYRKGVEERERAKQDKKDRLKRAVEGEEHIYDKRLNLALTFIRLRLQKTA